MHGTHHLIANYDPGTVVRLIKLIQGDDIAQYTKEANDVMTLERAVSEEVGALAAGGHIGEGSLVKPLMKLVGRPCGPAFPPQIEPTREQLEEIKNRLKKQGIL